MKISNASKLRKWVCKALDPICDTAEATSNYVLTLLKKDIEDVEELKTICIKELTTFLKDHTVSFVNDLFEVLNGKLVSYIAIQKYNIN